MLKWAALAAIALPVPALRAAPAEDATAAPASQPAGAADRRDQGATKVLLLPFQVVGGRQTQSWIGQSIQQSLLTDLVMGGPIRVSSSTTPAADPNAAIDAGKTAGARYVVYGQVHVNDRGEGAGAAAVRITAQVLDTNTGRPVGVLKSTGSIDDLFPVEDDLAQQAREQLGRIEYAARLDADRAAGAGAASGEPRPEVEPYGPVTMRSYGSPEWTDTGPSNIPSAAANRYYFGNPYNWYEITPAPAYVYPAPNYGGYPYYGGGSVSYSVSRYPLGSVVNPGINTPGGGMTPGTVPPRFVTEPPLRGVRLPTGPLVGPNPTPAAGPVPNQMGVTTPRSFPGHVFHGKTYGQTLGVQK
jgi:TolB-like protein